MGGAARRDTLAAAVPFTRRRGDFIVIRILAYAVGKEFAEALS